MSTKTGVAPVDRIALAVAANVWATVMTSSPGPSPRPAKIDISATVPLLIAIGVADAARAPPSAPRARATRRPWASIPPREDLRDGRDLLRRRCPVGRSGSCGRSLRGRGPLAPRGSRRPGRSRRRGRSAGRWRLGVDRVVRRLGRGADRRGSRARRAPQAQTQPSRRAGLPATSAWAGTSRVTTAPGADHREAADVDARRPRRRRRRSSSRGGAGSG